MSVGRLEELRARIQTLAIGIVLTAKSGSDGYQLHSECSEIARSLQGKLMSDLSMRWQTTEWNGYQQGDYGIGEFIDPDEPEDPHEPRPPATWQPAIGALVGKLQGLANACKKCEANVEYSRLDKFGLGLAGDDIRQVVMLPELYWAGKWWAE